MGESEFVLKECLIKTPKWYDLNMGIKGTEMGQILCSFNILEELSEFDDLAIDPDVEECTVGINALGLRGLQTLGILPIKKAFVKFDINSLYPPKEKNIIKSKSVVQTLPSEKGSSPNIT